MVNALLFNSHIKDSLNKSLTNQGWTKPKNSGIIVSPDGLYIIFTSEYRGTVTVTLEQVTETFDFKPVSITRLFRRDGHMIFKNAHHTRSVFNIESDMILSSNITSLNVVKNTDAVADYFINKILPQNIKDHKVITDLTKSFTRSVYIRCITESLLNILCEQGYEITKASQINKVYFELRHTLTNKVVVLKHKSSTKMVLELEPNTFVHIFSDKGVISIFNRDKIEKYIIGKSSNMNDLVEISKDISFNILHMAVI